VTFTKRAAISSRVFGGRSLTGATGTAIARLRGAESISPFATVLTPAMTTFATILTGIWRSLGTQAANQFLSSVLSENNLADLPISLTRTVDPFDLISEHLTDQTIAAAADELHDFLGPHASRLDLANLRRIADRNRVAASGLGAVPASESGVVPPRPPNTTPPPTVFGPLDSGAWLRIRFDMVNPYAVRFAADHAADLVTVITDETAQTINQVVERSTAGDWDVFETSNRIRDVVGLNERWRNAVLNRYQGMIDRGAEPAFASRIAHTYAEQLRTKRAMMIARTETMRAANQGRLASYNAAAEAGLISVNAEKEWITAPQGAEVSVEGKGPAKGTKIVSGPCAACAPMNGRKVAGINQKFLLPNGRAVLTPPAHPHCRCTHLVLTPPPPVQTTPQPDVEIVRPW